MWDVGEYSLVTDTVSFSQSCFSGEIFWMWHHSLLRRVCIWYALVHSHTANIQHIQSVGRSCTGEWGSCCSRPSCPDRSLRQREETLSGMSTRHWGGGRPWTKELCVLSVASGSRQHKDRCQIMSTQKLQTLLKKKEKKKALSWNVYTVYTLSICLYVCIFGKMFKQVHIYYCV